MMCKYCKNPGTRCSFERNRLDKGYWAICKGTSGYYMNCVNKTGVITDVVNIPVNNCPNCGELLGGDAE